MPLVHLALSEAQALRNPLDEVAAPLRVLQELALQDFQLLLVLPLPTLNVAVGRVVVFCFLEKRGNAVVEVFIFKFIGRDVEGKVGFCLLLSSGSVAEDGTRSRTGPAVSALVYQRRLEVGFIIYRLFILVRLLQSLCFSALLCLLDWLL